MPTLNLKWSPTERKALDEMLRHNEPRANLFVANILFGIAALALFGRLLLALGIFHMHTALADVTLIGCALVLLAAAAVCHLLKGQGSWIKYLLLVVLLIFLVSLNVLTGYHAWLAFALPVLFTCRYYDTRLTIATGLITCLLTLACAWTNAYVSPSIGYLDLNSVTLPASTLEVNGTLQHPVIGAELSADVLFSNSLTILGLPNVLCLICIIAACAMVTKHGQFMLVAAMRTAEAEAEARLETEKSKSCIAISQIQPHFLYNTISAIMAIDGNPDETVDSLGAFGKYLRENLNTLSSDEPIPVSRELQHVRRYVSLEQLRFGKNVKVEYDVQTEGFAIPALTIQMLVENAIKHGITKRREGGTVCISVLDEGSHYVIRVVDDGIGFNADAPIDAASHIGIANVRTRLRHSCEGTLALESAEGKGTTATVRIPKERIGR